jgi:prevent-host-death family protein
MPSLLDRTVTATEFQNKAGLYLDKAATGPVVITRHKRPSRVLVDFEEFQRLARLAKERPTRTAARAEDLDEDVVASLQGADFGHLDPALDELMR